ncbi:hypothetical protein [Kitasatospora purpeofusca]|uniref:hypothetical protein n=1 Tax=Kitasatospora purpeofusca TaxID=67352 RepID=UPI00386C2D37
MGELVTVRMCEGIARGFAADAGTRIAAVVSGADALVESLRIRVGTLGTAGSPGSPGTPPGAPGPPGVPAQVNAEVDGRRIRVQEAAADLGEALDRLADGLRVRLTAVTTGWAPRPWPRRTRARGLSAAPEPSTPVGSVRRLEVPCPPGPRRIVRQKRPQLVRCSPDAAARTMAAGPPTRSAVPLTLSPCGAPELSEEQAVERLTSAELPHLFFAQPGSGRGRMLYRRFDGGLGLIAAAS